MTSFTEAAVLMSERAALVRFCARYTGDRDAAEDLAQQTLLHAWQHKHQLKDSQARPGWLLSIARTQCLMWARRQGRELRRVVALDGAGEGAAHDQVACPGDLELALERDDLLRLLDHALALLPPDMRDMLVRRYMDEAPQAELAARLGLTEGAVEARLHRGKRALRRVLVTELGEEAVAYGLIPASAAGWEETRVWCPGCGQRRLEGWLRPAEGKLFMRCPDCSRAGAHFIHAKMGDGLRDIRGYKPAVTRVLRSIHTMFRVRASDGATPCPACGQWLPIARGEPPWVPSQFVDPESIYLWHPGCGGYDSETWHSLTWSLPAVRAFWAAHPRMRFVPPREVEVAGSPAVVTGFESVASAARLDVVTLRDTLEVVRIDGDLPAEVCADG
jgi:RNA polymerase sigma-70 factor (ECF subfamily)